MEERARERFPVLPVAMLALGLLALRLAYLAWACPYTLAEDEAHYWDWSRNPDWSYYSKGPGVAWLIAAMTRALGESELGVRAGAALFGSIATIGVAGTAHASFGLRRATVASAILFNLIPFYQVSSLLMTIDMPYVACWALASWCAVEAILRRRGAAWAALGACVAAGFLFKYTMVLIVPGIIFAALIARKSRPRDVRKGAGGWIALGVLIALAGLVPVGVWNAERDWPTVRHLLGHLGVSGGDVPTGREAWTPMWFIEFIEPRFGDEAQLARLSDELHKRGMKLVLDLVLNHVGPDAPLVKEKPDWFHRKGGVTDWNDPVQLTTYDVHGLPDLATERDDVATYLTDSSRRWLRARST